MSLRFDEAQTIHRQALIERPDDFVHYRTASSTPRALTKPESEDYYHEERLVCEGSGTGPIVGMLGATWNRECNIITGVTAIRWTTGGALVFAGGLRQFMDSLRARAYWVRWSASECLPQLDSYKRLAEQLGGGQVGRFEGNFIGPKGLPVASVYFQVPGRITCQRDRS